MSTENQEVVVEPAVEEKSETKEVKGTKRAAEEKKPEQAKKSKKDENGAEDDEEVDDENEEAEGENYELNYGEDIDGEDGSTLQYFNPLKDLLTSRIKSDLCNITYDKEFNKWQ